MLSLKYLRSVSLVKVAAYRASMLTIFVSHSPKQKLLSIYTYDDGKGREAQGKSGSHVEKYMEIL